MRPTTDKNRSKVINAFSKSLRTEVVKKAKAQERKRAKNSK